MLTKKTQFAARRRSVEETARKNPYPLEERVEKEFRGSEYCIVTIVCFLNAYRISDTLGGTVWK